MRAYVHVQRWGVTGDGLDPLINRIARNLLIDRHRRAAPHLVSLDAAEEVHDPAPDLDDQVLQHQRNVEVRSAVSELPERHRTAIMYSLKGMSPAEVAVQLGIGRNAADALLHRARRSLRERLRHVGEGMLGLGFWLGGKMRNGLRRAGLDGQVSMGGVAVEQGAAVLAATALAVVVGFGGGGFGGGADGPKAIGLPGSAAVAEVSHVATTEMAAPAGSVFGKGGGSGTSAGSGGTTLGMGPAQSKLGPRQPNHYTPDNETSVTYPDDSGNEIAGVGVDVFEAQDNETVGTVCGYAAGNCEELWNKERP